MKFTSHVKLIIKMIYLFLDRNFCSFKARLFFIIFLMIISNVELLINKLFLVLSVTMILFRVLKTFQHCHFSKDSSPV